MGPEAEECLVHQEDYQYHWSTDKIARCCARGFVPCRSNPGPPVTEAPVRAPEGPVDPFNCADGFLNWQGGRPRRSNGAVISMARDVGMMQKCRLLSTTAM